MVSVINCECAAIRGAGRCARGQPVWIKSGVGNGKAISCSLPPKSPGLHWIRKPLWPFGSGLECCHSLLILAGMGAGRRLSGGKSGPFGSPSPTLRDRLWHRTSLKFAKVGRHRQHPARVRSRRLPFALSCKVPRLGAPWARKRPKSDGSSEGRCRRLPAWRRGGSGSPEASGRRRGRG